VSSQAGKEFVESFLAHVYDPVKAHAYYERTKKLKGRKGPGFKPGPKTDAGKKPSFQTGPTNRQRVNANAANAAAKVGPERAAKIQSLADQAKKELDKITQDFRDWVSKNPRASGREKEAQKVKAVNLKNQVVKKLKADIAKITSVASNKTPSAATEGRHH